MSKINHLDVDNLPSPIIPKNKNYKDLTNQVFGELTALYPAGYLTKEKRLAWCCKCKCGQYLLVIAKHLLNGNTKSCGCYQAKRAVESNQSRGLQIKEGDIFGKLTVLKSLGLLSHGVKRGEKFLCKCSCGNEVEVWGIYLTQGETSSCGCLKSKGEQEIQSILTELKIPFQREYSYLDLVSENGFPLKFDFKIKNFLIEYQGDIHYSYRQNGWNQKEKYEKRKERDIQKKQYCQDKNIKLYEITYQDNCREKLMEILNKEGIFFE